MVLKVNNRKYDFFENVVVNLKFDSVASTFSFGLYFNPDNPEHRSLCKPLQYQQVSIEHDGIVLISGKILSFGGDESAAPGLSSISGYSKTGVLDDCTIPVSAYPLQSNGVSLKNITEKLLKPFGLKLTVDASVSDVVNKNYTITKAESTHTVKQYICELAAQKHIIVTHDAAGNLLFTRADTKQKPIFHFDEAAFGKQHMQLSVNGQDMHSSITVIRQASEETGNAGQHTINNPYVTEFRPKVVKQSSGTDNDTKTAARNLLSAELKNIKLTILMQDWYLNDTLVTPGKIVTVISPENNIHNTAYFFIESVDLSGNREKREATLTCYPVACYNNETPVNIFN